jgi:general secretion pathway protein G
MTVRHPRRAARRVAFTLMEVLVVVAILVILAGVGGVIYLRYLEDARVDKARIDIKTIEASVERYKVKMREFPPTLETMAQPSENMPAYIEESLLVDPWGHPYTYEPETLNPNTGKPKIFTTAPNGETIANW